MTIGHPHWHRATSQISTHVHLISKLVGSSWHVEKEMIFKCHRVNFIFFKCDLNTFGLAICMRNAPAWSLVNSPFIRRIWALEQRCLHDACSLFYTRCPELKCEHFRGRVFGPKSLPQRWADTLIWARYLTIVLLKRGEEIVLDPHHFVEKTKLRSSKNFDKSQKTFLEL